MYTVGVRDWEMIFWESKLSRLIFLQLHLLEISLVDFCGDSVQGFTESKGFAYFSAFLAVNKGIFIVGTLLELSWGRCVFTHNLFGPLILRRPPTFFSPPWLVAYKSKKNASYFLRQNESGSLSFAAEMQRCVFLKKVQIFVHRFPA